MKHYIWILLLFAACGKLDEPKEIPSKYPPVSFEEKIVPIFRNSCLLSGCHGKKGKSAFSIPTGQAANLEEIELGLQGKKAKSGKLLIDPGHPSQSEIILRLSAEIRSMPPLSKLPTNQQNDLNIWVAQGAKYR